MFAHVMMGHGVGCLITIKTGLEWFDGEKISANHSQIKHLPETSSHGKTDAWTPIWMGPTGPASLAIHLPR